MCISMHDSPVVKIFPHILRKDHDQIVHIMVLSRRDSCIEIIPELSFYCYSK